ncbi:MAG: ribonuclease HII [Deltaproteobacteria bacterium]|jgi:ribonuclease HII|nr:ribonuclease HII [Deltaproteobacteria bacterium]
MSAKSAGPRASILGQIPSVPTSEAGDGFFSPLFLFDRGFNLRPLAGLDEAGRGPLAGPLVAAAVVLPAGFDSPLVDDSKKLRPEAREKLYELVVSQALCWARAEISPAEVDRLNPLQASMTAMARSLAQLPVTVALALVDGNQAPPLPVPLRTVVGGDGLSLSIAAASIVAKVTRDRLMDEADKIYPQYGFARHKGYGTREHLEALKKHGPSPIHRLTYRGVLPAPPSGGRLF